MKTLFTMLFLFFGISLFAIEPGGGVSVEVLAKSTKSWDGSTLPKYSQKQPQVTILKVYVAPKARLVWHEHPVINAGVLLKGQLKVTTADNRVLYLKAGDPIIEVVHKWHYGVNEGNTTAEIIVFYAGVVGTPITVKELR